MISAIILAAGKGTRMHSEHAKVMHLVLGEPMLEHTYDTLKAAGVDRMVCVVGYGADEVTGHFGDRFDYAVQQPQLGSGHAVMQAAQLKGEKGRTLIVNGDCPLIRKETYQKLLDAGQQYPLVVLTAVLPEGGAYGRIVRSADGAVEKIVERKDASEQEAAIREINAGIYCVDNELLWRYLPELTNDNAQQEYYVTQLVEIFRRHGHTVGAVTGEDFREMSGINTRKELNAATAWLQQKVNDYWLDHGVSILSPGTTYIGTHVQLGEDVILYPNVRLSGDTVVGKDTVISEGSVLINARIGAHDTITSSLITDSTVGDFTTVGPWAHLRNGCQIGDHVRIGNFVEMKDTSLGEGTKCAHLTYVGDCRVGSHVNFGCGVVTVNYDGKHKLHSVIGDGAFIGSNVNIIAPVTIGEDALLAAGSTIDHDVAPGDMAIARPRQEAKKGYGLVYKNKK